MSTRDQITEIEEIIRTNLPAATAGVMKEFIQEAEATSQELEDTTKELKILRASYVESQKIVNDLNGIVEELEQRTVAQQELDKQRLELEARKRNFDVEMLEVQVSMLKLNKNELLGLVDKVFGHPGVTVTTHKTTPIYPDPSTGVTPYASSSQTETAEVTTEHTKK